MERRYLEIRFAEDTGSVSGTAMVYGAVADLGPFKERVLPGAFRPIEDVVLNFQHQRNRPLARTGGSGLVFKDDKERLEFTADITDQEVRSLVTRRILRGASVEMIVKRDRMIDGVREISRANLIGLALVDRPAHDLAQLREAFQAAGNRERLYRAGNRRRVML